MTDFDNKKSELSEKFEKEFSDRLRHFRNERKISAREMSLALGQNVNYVNLIENGKRLPSMQGFFSLCEYLKISPSQFFATDNFINAEDSKKSEKEEISEILCNLSSVQLKAVAELLKAFAT